MWDLEGRRKAEAISLGGHNGQTGRETKVIRPEGPSCPPSPLSPHPAPFLAASPSDHQSPQVHHKASDWTLSKGQIPQRQQFPHPFPQAPPLEFHVSSQAHVASWIFLKFQLSSQPVLKAGMTRDCFSDTVTSPFQTFISSWPFIFT